MIYDIQVPFNFVDVYSPFKVNSAPTHDASKVRASGPGLDTKGVAASMPVEFTIDARDAGKGLLTVQILVSFPIIISACRYLLIKMFAIHLKSVLNLGSRGKTKESQHP